MAEAAQDEAAEMGAVIPETETLPAGARFLRKPFEPEALAEAVRGLVSAHEAGRLAPDGSEMM